jgi:4-carboxymuconolactone decarboxylase
MNMPAWKSAMTHDDIARREGDVLREPPRIPPLTSEEMAGEAFEQTKQLRKAASGSAETLSHAEIPEVVTTLLRHPDLFKAVSGLSVQLLGNGTLSARDRELAILRTAWLWQAPYEWGEHVRLGKLAGISSDEIERVTVGSSAPGWGAYEAAIMSAVEELVDGAMISDETWAVLAQRLDYRQQFELMVVVGQFTNVAFFQNALRLRLAKGNLGLRER